MYIYKNIDMIRRVCFRFDICQRVSDALNVSTIDVFVQLHNFDNEFEVNDTIIEECFKVFNNEINKRSSQQYIRRFLKRSMGDRRKVL